MTAYLFTHETLLRELRAFVTGSSQAKPDIDQLPNLFVFALRLALITLVGHYLEGRHRGIRLQIVSGGGNTKPGLQSFKMRWKEHARNLLANRFIIFLGSVWRSKTSLTTLLETTYVESEYRKLTYGMRIAKLYNYDAVSQFRPADHLKDAIKAWSRIARPSTALAIAHQPIENCAIDYIKNRLDTKALSLRLRPPCEDTCA